MVAVRWPDSESGFLVSLAMKPTYPGGNFTSFPCSGYPRKEASWTATQISSVLTKKWVIFANSDATFFSIDQSLLVDVCGEEFVNFGGSIVVDLARYGMHRTRFTFSIRNIRTELDVQSHFSFCFIDFPRVILKIDTVPKMIDTDNDSKQECAGVLLAFLHCKVSKPWRNRKWY